MPSIIDPNKPFDGLPASKADLRANLAAAKQELEHGGFAEGLTPSNYSAANSQVKSHLAGIDTALSGVGGGGHVIQDKGTPLTQRSALNFVGDGVTATDLAGVSTITIPGAAAGNFLQAGTGAVSRSVQDKLREYMVSVKDFGAVGDGVTDDTAAIQLAIDYIATTKQTGHSAILFSGIFKYTPASLDWSGIIDGVGRSVVTLYVDGTLKPQGGPVLIESGMHLVGIGGNLGGQFMLAPCCAIQAATGQVGVWVQTHGNHTIRNVMVYGSSQPAVLLTGADSSIEEGLGSLYRLENIGVISGTGTDADCIRTENVFWLWIRNFTLLCQETGGWALHAHDVSTTAISKASGIFYVEDGVIASKGVRLTNTVTTGTGHTGNMLFRNIVMESAITSMFTLDTVSPVDAFVLDRVFMADTISGAGLVEVVNTRPNYICFKDCGPEQKIVGPAPRRMIVTGTPRPFLGGTDLYSLTADGNYPRRGFIEVNGQIDTIDAFRNSEMLPNMLPCQNLGAKQDATTWGATFNVTAGQAAPDGSSTAYLLAHTGTGGRQTGRLYIDTPAMVDGDFIIAGMWVKSAVPTQRLTPNEFAGLTVMTNPPYLDGKQTVTLGNDERAIFTHAGWVLIVDWWKWEGGGAAGLVFDAVIDAAGYSYYAWRPFLLRVDGRTHTERDVARIAARMTVIDQNAKPGVLTQLPHHTFRTGIGATGARPSASAVGAGAQWFDSTLKKPIWSDGMAWRDALGSLV